MSPGSWSLPIAAGFGYSLAVVAIRGAIVRGASGARVNLACNAVMALVFQCLWLVPCAPFDWREVVRPLLCGGLFFLGQFLTFRAIAAGDVSVSTPLMGTKVLFVALFTVLIARTPLPGSWWLACLMASSGIALISHDRHGSNRGVGGAVLWSLAAAAVFALTDLLVQTGVPRVGYPRFAPIMFGTTGILSLRYLPGVLGRGLSSGQAGVAAARSRSEPWLLAGAALLAVQALAMYSAIGLYGSAALTNILYGSRCLWSVLLAWSLATLLRRDSEKIPRRAMGRRLAGAVLLLGAMALVLLASPR